VWDIRAGWFTTWGDSRRGETFVTERRFFESHKIRRPETTAQHDRLNMWGMHAYKMYSRCIHFRTPFALFIYFMLSSSIVYFFGLILNHLIPSSAFLNSAGWAHFRISWICTKSINICMAKIRLTARKFGWHQ